MRGRARTDLSSAGPSFSTSYTRSASAARAACAMTALRLVEGEALVARWRLEQGRCLVAAAAQQDDEAHELRDVVRKLSIVLPYLAK